MTQSISQPLRAICSFVVPGDPVGKGRPRFTRMGRTFTPQKTVTAESMVAMNARLVLGDPEPSAQPCIVDIDAAFAMPKTWSKKKRALMAGRRCTKKPDGDNIAKLVGDALNGLVWRDDSQVADWSIKKRWAEHGEMVVRIYEETP